MIWNRLAEHPDLYREGPGFESQRDHRNGKEAIKNW